MMVITLHISVQYTMGRAIQWQMFSTLGDIMSTLGMLSTPEGYHGYTGDDHDKCKGR